MEDIKTLYLTAKSSGNQKDVDSYLQCIRESIEKDPVNYVTNLEYIISSNVGLATFKEFVEKRGLSIGWYDTVMEAMENCIHKCKINEKDATAYNETVAWLESYKKNYTHCFAVFESFKDDLPNDYLRTYYSDNKAGIQHRRLLNGMMKKFNEAAIPDAVITADFLGEHAITTVLCEFNSFLFSDPKFNQCALESFKDIDIKSGKQFLIPNSLEAIVESMNVKYNQAFQESVIMGDETISAEYTEAEVKALQDLISFKENMITCLESVDEIMATQKEIYSLYERFESLISLNEDVLQEDIANSVIPMLPGARASSRVNPVEESNWLSNTGNKKTGSMPDYIKKNHNLGYGEDDASNHRGRPGDDTEPVLDDYKRPSATSSVPDDVETLLEPDTSKNTAFPDEPPKEHSDGKPLTNEEKQAINNYYYYTYTNSLNRNANSFNKHNSHRDDHSTGKRVHSDNINNMPDDGDDPLDESGLPWKLDLDELLPQNFNEGALSLIAGIIFFTPIVLGAGVVIGSMISQKIMKKKYENKTKKVISDIIGTPVKNIKEYTDKASKEFSNFMKEQESSITNHFYKFKESGSEIDLTPAAFFSFGSNSDKLPGIDDCTEANLVLGAQYVVTGLVKKSSVSKLSESLNKLSPDIKFGVSLSDNLPGDDSGGDWSYYIKAGICEGGPDDAIEKHRSGELSEEEIGKWQNDQFTKIEKSGYVVVSLSISMAAKKFILKNFDGVRRTSSKETTVITESIFDNIRKRIFQKKDSPTIPETVKVYHKDYLPLTDEIQTTIIKNILGLRSRLSQKLNPIFQKYPIYGFTINLDDDEIKNYCTILIDNPDKPGETMLVPGIDVVNGKMDAVIPVEVDGYDQYDFSEHIGKKYPDEVKRLSEKYDIDSRSDWTQIHWMEKLCGYDKCLDEICNEITSIINAEFKEVVGFEYVGDNDSGPIFSGNIDIKFLYPNFDSSQIKVATWTYNPKPVESMSNSEKHFFGIYHSRTLTEAVGDADDMKPQSDHPVKDVLTDIDRELVKKQQATKKALQNTVNVGKAFVKPVQRTTQWVSNMVNQWKDADENKVKEKLADPHARSGLFEAIKAAIKYGSLAKAGLLFNPIFLFLSLTRGVGKNKREFRLRNEMIGEIKTEIQIIDEKIKDADRLGDNKAKYQLMRFKNELNKKLIRVGGNKKIAKLI